MMAFYYRTAMTDEGRRYMWRLIFDCYMRGIMYDGKLQSYTNPNNINVYLSG